MIYLDGILGHLYDRNNGVRIVLRRFQSWLSKGGALVISNDPPRADTPDGAQVQEHQDLPYFFLSQRYLHRQVEECGFRDVTSTAFTYQKPLSGPRDRIVVTGRRW